MTIVTYPQQHQLIYQQIIKPPTNGPAVAAMILGIIAAAVGVWSLIPFAGLVAAVLGFGPGVAAVICGHIGTKRAAAIGGTGRGQAIAGLILGYATVGLIVLVTVFWIGLMVIGNIASSSSAY